MSPAGDKQASSAGDGKPAKTPAGKQPAGKKPAGKKPAAKKPAAKKPAAKKPAAKQPAATKPAATKVSAKTAAKTTAKSTARTAGPPDGKVTNWDGKKGSATLDVGGLSGPVKMRLLREAVRMYEANVRQGTHSTKTRGETAYTTRKPYRQKGTGNARRGDFNSPITRGGGVTFGPRPRDHGFALPRKSLREALKVALLGKLRDGEVATFASKSLSEPSTKSAAAALAGLGCEGSAVIVLPEDQPLVWKSFRNLERVHVVRAGDLNARHVLVHRNAVFVDDAWDRVMGRLAGTATDKVAEESAA